MKLEVFSTLEAVLREGTFATAAARQNITQSAVSMRIKQLEEYVGRPLFDRSGLQAKPTPLAYEVLDATRAAMQRVEALRARNSMRVEGSVRAGMVDSLQPSLLPGTVARLREQFPQLNVKWARGRSAALTTAVKAGEIDAAVISQAGTGAHAGLRVRRLAGIELVLAVPPGTREMSVAALFRQFEWIRYDPETVSGKLAAQWVQVHARSARAELELGSVAAILPMVSAGLGIAVLPAPDAAQLRAHPVKLVTLGRHAPTVQVVLLCRKTDTDNRRIGAVHEAIAQSIAERSPRA